MSVEMKIFYPEGKPDGEVSIKKIGASGNAVAFPRELCLAVCRDEGHDIFQWPCVYVLWRPGTHNQKPKVYVGESDSIPQRMTQHFHRKSFWTRAVVYTDTNGDLGKTHALHIEARLSERAEEAQVCDLLNEKKRRKRSQNKADIDAADRHINDLCRFFFPLVGCDFFRPHSAIAAQESKPAKPKQEAAPVADAEVFGKADLFLTSSRNAIKARGREMKSGFLVYAGSQASKHEAPSLRQSPGLKHHASLRDDLKRQNLLVDKGDFYCFSQDYIFKSPSKAASVILGASINGLARWKNTEGRTLGDIKHNPQGEIAEPKLAESKPQLTPLDTIVTIFLNADLFLNAPKRGIKARGRETDTGFLVYAGSQIAKKEARSLHHSKYKSNIVIREHLKERKLLADDGNVYRLSQDYLFKSSSAAATAILGTSSNGFDKWKDTAGRTLGELQKQRT